MSDTPTSEPSDEPAGADPPLYVVAPGVNECAVLEGDTFPRRPDRGSRGVLIVDRPAEQVYLLDADDDARMFRARERRPLAGDPTDMNPPDDGTDHVVRAAFEGVYDVIAAPWVDDGDTGEQPGLGQLLPATTPGYEVTS